MKIVLDTNVLVSALLTPFGLPAQVLNLVISGSVLLVLDTRIYQEYTSVLSRAYFKFNPQRQKELLDFILVEADFIAPTPLNVKLPDLDDIPFLEVACSSDCQALVSGNLKHFPKNITQKLGITVQNPAQFLDTFLSMQR